MKQIITKNTETTPSVIFNQMTSTLTIEGKLIPFDSEMYWSLINYQLKNLKIKSVEFNLEYINTNSIVQLVKFLTNNTFNVTWNYEEFDDDMYDLGLNLEKITKNKFKFFILENVNYDFVS